MVIKEVSKSWKGEFEVPGLPELTEDEIKALKTVVRSAGDVLAALASLPEEISPEAKETIIGVIGFVMSEAKNNAIMSVDQIIGGEAMRAPLENEFSPESIFGLNLKEELVKILTPDEVRLAAEHYTELNQDDGEENPDSNQEESEE